MRNHIKKLIACFAVLLSGSLIAACARGTGSLKENGSKEDQSEKKEGTEMDEIKKMFDGIKLSDVIKPLTDHNPLMVQRFGADPYALVYDGRVYIYMTGDDIMYNEDGSVKENNYSNIYTLNVISSADLVNWTDHGSVYAASSKGQATWGSNSWAPAAAYKNIDGKVFYVRRETLTMVFP